MVTTALLYIALAGAVGGLGNAFLSDNRGIVLPQKVTADGKTIYRPGFLVNIFMGALAAFVSWALYGAGSEADLLGSSAAVPHLKFPALAGALLVGLGGARWLSNEADKQLLRAATTQALDAAGATDQAKQAATSTPTQALHIAEEVAKEAQDKKPEGLPDGPVNRPQNRIYVDPNKAADTIQDPSRDDRSK